jgi:hypothetical protein
VDYRTERLQRPEDLQVDQVARMEDQIGLAAAFQAACRNRPLTARQVRVADDRQLDTANPRSTSG